MSDPVPGPPSEHESVRVRTLSRHDRREAPQGGLDLDDVNAMAAAGWDVVNFVQETGRTTDATGAHGLGWYVMRRPRPSL